MRDCLGLWQDPEGSVSPKLRATGPPLLPQQGHFATTALGAQESPLLPGAATASPAMLHGMARSMASPPACSLQSATCAAPGQKVARSPQAERSGWQDLVTWPPATQRKAGVEPGADLRAAPKAPAFRDCGPLIPFWAHHAFCGNALPAPSPWPSLLGRILRADVTSSWKESLLHGPSGFSGSRAITLL